MARRPVCTQTVITVWEVAPSGGTSIIDTTHHIHTTGREKERAEKSSSILCAEVAIKPFSRNADMSAADVLSFIITNWGAAAVSNEAKPDA